MITYKYKLYKNKRKFKYLDSLLNIACDIYNFALNHKQNLYEKDKISISKNDLQKVIVKKKDTNRPEWNKLGSQVAQQITDRIYNGYDLFFKNIKIAKKDRKRKVNPPKFKKYNRYKSITFKQTGYGLIDKNTIRIGNEIFKFNKNKKRNIEGKIKTLTVKKNNLGEYFIFITTDYVFSFKEKTDEKYDESEKIIPQSGNKIGFDFGLSIFLTANTLSGEDDIISPLFFKQDIEIIRKLSKKLSKKKKGSNNRKKAILNINRAYDKITNRRENFHWKLARELIKKYDTIFLETLDVVSMKKHHGKKINDLGFSDFLLILNYLAIKHKKTIIYIDKWYPSSKICSNCLTYNKLLGQYDKIWVCENCNMEHDRDRNAAINIFRVGASTLAGDYVKPKLSKKDNLVVIVDSKIQRL